MTLRRKFANLTRRPVPRFMLAMVTMVAMLAIAPCAHAEWTLVRADAPLTVIHASSVYEARSGQRLLADDIVGNSSSGVVQMQDDEGNVLALGPDTHVLLARDSHLAVLRGWIKVLHACNVSTCAALDIDTARTRFVPTANSALVIAATTLAYGNADAVFCESGSTQVLASGKPQSKPAMVQIEAHRFALHAEGSATITVSASPDHAFVAAMPVTFRDALRKVPTPADAHNLPTHGLRPVNYDDVSPWLNSTLAVRTDPSTHFAARFRSRLFDPAFRRDITQHLRDLPEWRPLVFPPPRRASRSTAVAPPSAYSSIWVRP